MQVEVALPLPLENLFTYKVPEKYCDQIKAGRQVLVPFRNHSLSGVVVGLNPSGEVGVQLKEIQFVYSSTQAIPAYFLDLTKWISEEYACSWGETLSLIALSLKGSVKRAYAEGQSHRFDSLAKEVLEPFKEQQKPFMLTSDQTDALKKIEEIIPKNEFKTFLLFGVTSSGKTEIYLRAIESALNEKKQALFLVPEISLCPAFFEILKRRFGGRVALWHSQVSAGQKRNTLDQIRKGSVDIIVGARSALFVPLDRLGIVVLDEEHDTSYKQQEKPRYHAREAAVKLAQIQNAVVVLGSATPSIESFYRAEKGEFTLLELPQRIPTHSLPSIKLVDRRSKSSGFSPLTQELVQAVSVALARREQVILALNRRGYTTFLLCSACGFVWRCANCELTLIHHQDSSSGKTEYSLRCHFCFYKKKVPLQCERCKSYALLSGGFGTQKVVQELKRIFPAARVLRLDSDISRKKSVSSSTYQTFREESADILVGTQMVTQGFDFPRVTLVGILDADTALHHADFRASEKTFQWILQASGRAGRSSLGGQVIVQSSVPDHYALEFACRQDYRPFYNKEVEFRKALHYPPFSKLVLFRIQSSKKKELVIPESERLAECLKKSGLGDQILGPGPSTKEHLRKQVRWQILVKCRDKESLLKIVNAGKSFVPKSGVRVMMDVDPYDVV